ncbi:MAG: hypothetical protein CI953_117 [Methanohalophilus sp.]|nr:MAG: hypothetical protein CI953_117 [Methanohalophilus sp.]
MPKLNPVDWKTLVKRLRELGFEGPYSGGKIGVALLKRILKQAKIARDKWLETN